MAANVSKRNAKAYVSKEDDRSSDEEDYYTNVWKTNLEIDPVIFRRSEKHVNAKMKEIQELSGHLYKNAKTSTDDDTLSNGKDLCTWKPDMETRQKSKKQVKSKIKEIKTPDRLCKKAATKDVSPYSASMSRSNSSKHRKLTVSETAVLSTKVCGKT